jgi:hypothetical protein
MRLSVPIGLLVAGTVGYLAGTKDGRRRAEQLRAAADSFAQEQHLAEKANRATAAATAAGGAAVAKAKDVAGTMSQAAKSKISDKNGNATIDVTDGLLADTTTDAEAGAVGQTP